MKLSRILAATTMFAAVALLVVACSSPALGPSSAGVAAGSTTLNSCEKPEAEICGNKIDDDCDGKVDEDCTVCRDVEVCDNGIDDDCDGNVDEDCEVCKPVTEICGDKIDNDCDGQIDEDCTEGELCSPGYWKNHPPSTAVCNAAVAASGGIFTSCAQLISALSCKGSEAECNRNFAGDLLSLASDPICFE